jgi:hypothetical protein
MANYFYTTDGNQFGPVSEIELGQLVDTHALPPDVFVWTDGMAAWQPWSAVKSVKGNTASGITCCVCQHEYPSHQITRHKADSVCTICNDEYLSRSGKSSSSSRRAWVSLIVIFMAVPLAYLGYSRKPANSQPNRLVRSEPLPLKSHGGSYTNEIADLPGNKFLAITQSQPFTARQNEIFGSMRAAIDNIKSASQTERAAFDRIPAAMLIQPRHLTNQTQLTESAAAIAAFERASASFKTLLKNAPEQLRQELRKTDSKAQRSTRLIAEGFKEGLDEQIPRLLQVQALDDTAAEALLELGTFYESRWGTWYWDNPGQTVVFSTEKDNATYRQLCRKISTAADQQEALQKQLRRKIPRAS